MFSFFLKLAYLDHFAIYFQTEVSLISDLQADNDNPISPSPSLSMVAIRKHSAPPRPPRHLKQADHHCHHLRQHIQTQRCTSFGCYLICIDGPTTIPVRNLDDPKYLQIRMESTEMLFLMSLVIVKGSIHIHDLMGMRYIKNTLFTLDKSVVQDG